MQRLERNKLQSIHTILKQYNVNSVIKGGLLNYNGKTYDAHEALSLVKNLPDINPSDLAKRVNATTSQNFNDNPIPSNISIRKRNREISDHFDKSAKIPRGEMPTGTQSNGLDIAESLGQE